MKTTRQFGKCRDCKSAVVVDAKPGNAYLMPSGDSVEIAPYQYARSLNMVLVPFHILAQGGYVSCKCGAAVRSFSALVGRFSEKHVCGAKCLNSKGPSCECSCGGANHGSGHLAAAA